MTVNQECLETFQELKLRKKAKYIIFTLNKEKTEIIVEKTSTVNEYEDFLGDLPEAECRWAVYDFEFLNEENSKRNKIIFYSWYAFTLPPPPPLKIPNKRPLFFFFFCPSATLFATCVGHPITRRSKIRWCLRLRETPFDAPSSVSRWRSKVPTIARWLTRLVGASSFAV